MKFIYFACEFYKISNAIAYETFILNYNGKFNLCIFFNLHIYVMTLKLTFIYLIFKFSLFDHATVVR